MRKHRKQCKLHSGKYVYGGCSVNNSVNIEAPFAMRQQKGGRQMGDKEPPRGKSR
jgi:hypothetical protein